ncbi:MAG: tetratricopeptide repeat protein [Saprospiraceae bacterium]|nr:tetratricopeptide repeat protein [Saprospiraceae bacterium]
MNQVKWISLVIYMLTSLVIRAQNKAMLSAFEESYQLEASWEYDKAIETLKGVYDQKSYECNLRLGWLYYSSRQYLESSKYYQKAIDIRPMSIEARLGFVLPEAALSNWNSVLEKYEEILKIDPHNSVVNYRVGSIYYGRKAYKKAEVHFEKVINSYPFDYNSLLMQGWTKYFLGKTTEAKVLFNKVLLYSPDDKSALEGLGLIR